jgi:hypothetical protein
MCGKPLFGAREHTVREIAQGAGESSPGGKEGDEPSDYFLNSSNSN